MAVTAADKKYLNQTGVAAVQAATDKYNKAVAAQDAVGMKQAASDAAAVRSNTSYQANTSMGGYSTNGDGTYKTHDSGYVDTSLIPSSSKSTGSTSTGTTSTGTTQANRDIAGEIISMLSSGGQIDYTKLNSLAAERDAKINSDPSKYGQFEDTATIINRYLPAARLAETPTTAASTTSTEVDSVITLLKNLANSSYDGLSYDDAQSQAASELNPQYADAAQTLKNSLNADMEQRGIYNSPLASGIMTEKQGKLSNEQVAAIASRASELVKDDADLTLQQKQLQSTTLSNLLTSLIGRETSVADLTGYYNGDQTLAREQYNTDTNLKEADLTGTYNGQDTLAKQQADVTTLHTQLTDALNSVSVLGKVTTQDQADLLGVPVGSSSEAAQEAAADRQQELYMFEKESQLKSYSTSISGSSASSSNMLAQFNKDMKIWETTGKAPDTAAMRYYGITPGTAWSTEASMTATEKLKDVQSQIELMDAQEELNFRNRANNIGKTYNLNSSTAEAAVLVLDQATNYADAQSIVNAKSSDLTNEGVNLNSLSTTLKNYYNLKDHISGNRGTTTNTASSSGSTSSGSYTVQREK